MKRVFDWAFACVALIALSPCFLAIVLLIKLADEGPVFFYQQRIGKDFRPFRLIKFRTMRTARDEPGPRITIAGDQRITRIGGWLRWTKLDELPQLWNVLRGDMSLVGPRPEVEEYVRLYRDAYREILTVRPGLTDISSIVFRDESKLLATADDPIREYINVILPKKLHLSARYLKQQSLLSDVKILIQTARVVAFPRRSVRAPILAKKELDS